MGGDGRLNTSVNVGEAAEPGREELCPDSGGGEAGLDARGGKWLGVVDAWDVHSLRTRTEREVRCRTGCGTH